MNTAPGLTVIIDPRGMPGAYPAEGFLSGRAYGGVNYLAPRGSATRAEVALIMTRFVSCLQK